MISAWAELVRLREVIEVGVGVHGVAFTVIHHCPRQGF